MEYITLGHMSLLLGISLTVIGFWGILTQKNIIKIILSFTIADAGVNIVIVSLGYVVGKTAPIIDNAVVQEAGRNVSASVVDPIPQALVLTSIVIGFGVTALMLAFAMKMFTAKKTLDINQFNELKW